MGSPSVLTTLDRGVAAIIARRGRPQTIINDKGMEFTSMAILG